MPPTIFFSEVADGRGYILVLLLYILGIGGFILTLSGDLIVSLVRYFDGLAIAGSLVLLFQLGLFLLELDLVASLLESLLSFGMHLFRIFRDCTM